MDEYRTWQLCKLLHCPPSALLDERAADLDWLLAVDETVAKARRNLEKREARRG
jgi:hypothetical protein